MNLAQLKTFLAVVDSGSFSAAARRLHCVQSNVTRQIRQLEEHFGQPVFRRGRGGAQLTRFGERLKEHAIALVHQFEVAERELTEAAGGAAPLALGSMETTAAVRLPAILKRLKAECPNAVVSLQTGSSSDIQQRLWERKIDAAFVAGPIDPDRFSSVSAFDEDLVCASSSALGTGGPLLAFRSGCNYRTVAETWFSDENHRAVEVLEMGSLEGILGCVEAGMGFAVAPRSAVEMYRNVEDLCVAQLPERYARVSTHLCWRLDHKPVRALRALIGFFRST